MQRYTSNHSISWISSTSPILLNQLTLAAVLSPAVSTMSNYNQYPQGANYPPPGTAEAQGGYMVPAPPGNPVKDGQQIQTPPEKTESRGGGFWRGCCAGLCCCCLLDACF